MNNLFSWDIFKSRTVWTVIVMVIINGFPSVRGMLPGGWLPLADAILGVAGVYFRVNTRINFPSNS